MLNTLKLPSPAKLNLFLQVINKREDGYHNLYTLFHFINFCDTLSFELTNDSNITLQTTPKLDVNLKENFIHKAAKLLQENFQPNYGVHINLNKKIPMGGGLGGGSSNAATTLLALNKLWQLQLKTEQLCELGLSLGSDVPIFIYGHSALATGRGENFQDLKVPIKYYLLLIPPIKSSTREIFCKLDLTQRQKMRTIGNRSFQMGENDLTKTVIDAYPEIAELMSWASNYGNPSLSGSGSCVFLSFENKQDAEAASLKLPAKIKAVVAQGCQTSPCLSSLNHN